MASESTGAVTRGDFGWMFDQGVTRVTVHHIAALSRKRVRDVRFVLSCEGIAEDRETSTVSIADVLRRWPDA